MMKIQNSEKGFALITVLIVMAVLLLLGAGVLTSVLFDLKISKSQKIATQTYYLAEAGINEAIWKLNNDDAWKNDFENKPDWSSPDLVGGSTLGGSYTVTIQNIALAQGKITSTATIDLDGKKAQRKIKTEVFKAIGGPTDGMAVFSGGKGKHDEMKIKNSVIDIDNGEGGDIFSNGGVKLEKKGEITVDKILAVKEIKKPKKEGDCPTLNVNAICAKDTCEGDCTEEGCPPASIGMPKVNFDKGENSYKGQADVVYTEKEFENNILWPALEKGETITLTDPITYVKGSVRLRGGITLVINNGVLVAGKNIEIGKHKDWKKKGEDQKYTGDNQIIINNDNPDLEGGPATGLLAKRKIEFGEHTSSSTITGLLYAGKEIKLKKVKKPNTLTVTGAIMAKKIRFEDLGELNITLNDTIKHNVLANQIYSPIISVEHWEETY